MHTNPPKVYPHARARLALGLAIVAPLALAACQGRPSTQGQAQQPAINDLLARTPAPAAPLDKLAFMAGAWIPNDTQQAKGFGEEHWTAPRGSNMAGLFRMVEPNGTVDFQELTTINAEPDGVFLRLRHVHGPDMMVKPTEAEAQVFKLRTDAPLDGSSATFDAVVHARNVTAVTYRRVDAQTLELTVNLTPGGRTTQRVITYRRLRPGT
jgi:hypothetical protein